MPSPRTRGKSSAADVQGDTGRMRPEREMRLPERRLGQGHAIRREDGEDLGEQRERRKPQRQRGGARDRARQAGRRLAVPEGPARREPEGGERADQGGRLEVAREREQKEERRQEREGARAQAPSGSRRRSIAKRIQGASARTAACGKSSHAVMARENAKATAPK